MDIDFTTLVALLEGLRREAEQRRVNGHAQIERDYELDVEAIDRCDRRLKVSAKTPAKSAPKKTGASKGNGRPIAANPPLEAMANKSVTPIVVCRKAIGQMEGSIEVYSVEGFIKQRWPDHLPNRKSISRTLDKLRRKGEIVAVHKGGGGKPTVYRVGKLRSERMNQMGLLDTANPE